MTVGVQMVDEGRVMISGGKIEVCLPFSFTLEKLFVLTVVDLKVVENLLFPSLFLWSEVSCEIWLISESSNFTHEHPRLTFANLNTKHKPSLLKPFIYPTCIQCNVLIAIKIYEIVDRQSYLLDVQLTSRLKLRNVLGYNTNPN